MRDSLDVEPCVEFRDLLRDPEFCREDWPPEDSEVEAEASLNARSPARTVEVIPDGEANTDVFTVSGLEKIALG